MVVIEGPRRSGRTTKLLEMANEAKGCFVTATQYQREFWKTEAKHMGMNDVVIISADDLKMLRRMDGNGIYKKKLFINDLDHLIYSYFGFEIAGAVVKSRDDIEVIRMTPYGETEKEVNAD